MEISEINIISDIQAGMKCLQNPSFVSRLSSMEIYPHLQFYSFWKWGAIIFAIYASLSSLAKKIKIVFVYFRRVKPSSLLHQKFEQILVFSSDDYDEDVEDDDDIISLASSSSPSSDDEDVSDDESAGDGGPLSRVKGSRLWLRSQWQNGHSWQNISKQNVVRFWDRLGLNLDFDEDLISFAGGSDAAVVSKWGFDSDHGDGYASEADVIPSVVMTAEGDAGRGGSVVVRGFDGRIRRRMPALYGEWSSQPGDGGSIAAVFSGERVYVGVRDDAGGLMAVGDVRNMRMPLDGDGRR